MLTWNFNPDEKRVRMAQALENYVLPQQQMNIPQMQTAAGINPMNVFKMSQMRKPIGTGMTPYSASMLPF